MALETLSFVDVRFIAYNKNPNRYRVLRTLQNAVRDGGSVAG
jgi:hypothetical protein